MRHSRGFSALCGVLLALSLVTLPVSGSVKKAPNKKKLPILSTLPTDTVQFTTRRGTWISVDVSPDSKQIVFDLLGDLYLLPIAGGTAQRLTSGRAWDHQPRWSPDGRQILFTSDRDGCSNSWVIDADGKNARAVTRNKWVVANLPVWSADGQYIVNRRRITDRSSIGTVALWMHHVLGGNGVQLTKGKLIGDANDPAFSRDGRYLYFAARPRFQYNRNIHGEISKIMRLDLRSGKKLVIASGATRPQPSPDSKSLAMVRRVGKKTLLVVLDLAQGTERTLADDLDRDMQEGFAANGTSPGFSWTPDGKSIVYSAGGQIQRLWLEGKRRQTIRFSADVQQRVVRALQFAHRITDDTFSPRVLRWFRVAPQNTWAVWSAMGRIWWASWPDLKTPKPLTDAGIASYAPAFSKDGKWLTYVTWSNTKRGQIWVRRVVGKGRLGRAKQVTTVPGYYSNPSFSPDGEWLVAVKGSGVEARGVAPSGQFWLQVIVISLKDGSAKPVVTLKNRGSLSTMPQPRFSRDGKRIFFTRYAMKKARKDTTLCSARVDGTDETRLLTVDAGETMVVSADERWVMFWHQHQIYFAALPTARKSPISLGIKDGGLGGSSLPVLRLSTAGGLWPSFTASGELLYTLGSTVYSLRLSDVLQVIRHKAQDPKSKAAVKPVSHEVALRVPVAKPKGCVALTNARLVTMVGDQVIARGTIVIRGARIAEIGANVSVPAGCKRIDVSGKTALPGFVDTHAHLHYTTLEIYPEHHWEHYVNLAYGVTTAFDPSAPTEFALSLAERIRAGYTVGPRIFTTGFVLYGAQMPHNAVVHKLADARMHVKRLKKLGALAIKSYMQPTRRQRQWFIKAAYESKLLVMPEGGGNLAMNLTMVLDGHTGIEHALPIAPLYDDVVQLFARSKSGYTPTLLVAYGGIFGENYFYQFRPIYNEPKLGRFFPPRLLAAKSRRRSVLVHDGDWHFRKIAASAKRIVDAGGRVQIGSHGQLQGLGYHWEMQALGMGGMTPHHVLRAATRHGAIYLGLEQDLGSLQRGKLADIVIVEGDPLRRLRDAERIQLVVKNGVVYRAETMAQIWPRQKPRPRFFWELTSGR